MTSLIVLIAAHRNSAASIMGRTYPGAGGTIGPALTGGFAAAESAAAENAQPAAEAAQ